MLSRVPRPGVRQNRDRSSQSTCGPLVPGVWLTRSFSPREWVEVFTVWSLSNKNSRKEISKYIILTLHRKKWPFFSSIASETDLEEIGVCRQFFKPLSWRNDKHRWMSLAKYIVELQENGPDSPVSRVKHACEGAEASISRY